MSGAFESSFFLAKNRTIFGKSKDCSAVDFSFTAKYIARAMLLLEIAAILITNDLCLFAFCFCFHYKKKKKKTNGPQHTTTEKKKKKKKKKRKNFFLIIRAAISNNN